MTRNSWFSTYVPTHPGVDIYLREDGNDVMRMATELENPIRLLDKRGVRLQMRKTVSLSIVEIKNKITDKMRFASGAQNKACEV